MVKKIVITVTIALILGSVGCNGGYKDNKNPIKNKSYSELALETLEERYGEPFEISQIGGTFGATRNTKKFICNPISNPNTYCFVEVEKDKSEVHDDYANRIMEEKFSVMLEEEAKKIFDQELNIKLSFNPSDNNYEYLDMDLLDFYKDYVYSNYSIHLFVNSDGNIDKNSEAEMIIKFAQKVINIGLNKNSSIFVWYCKEDIYNELDDSYYNISLSNKLSEYYLDKNKTYNNTYITLREETLTEDVKGIIGNFQ